MRVRREWAYPLSVGGGFDDGFQCDQMLLKSGAPVRRESVPTDGLALNELLIHGDVARVLELAKLCPEVPVRFIEQRLQPRETQRVGAAQQHDGAQAAAMLEQRIEPIQTIWAALAEIGLDSTHPKTPNPPPTTNLCRHGWSDRQTVGDPE